MLKKNETISLLICIPVQQKIVECRISSQATIAQSLSLLQNLLKECTTDYFCITMESLLYDPKTFCFPDKNATLKSLNLRDFDVLYLV